MRIGIVIDALDSTPGGRQTYATNGGIGTYILALVEELTRIDTKHHFVLLRSKPGGARFVDHPQVTQRTLPFSFFSTPLRLSGIWRDWIVRQEKLDLLHIPDPCSSLFFMTNCPVVLTIHDIIAISHPEYFTRKHALSFRFQAAASIRRADRIIAVSDYTASELQRHFPAASPRTTVIHLAGQKWPPSDPVDDTLLPDKPFILSVATLEPRKNLASLLDAFLTIRQAGHDFQLALTGPAGWKNRQILEHPAFRVYPRDILLTGVVQPARLHALYAAAAVFVYPSYREGFGLPPLEAMAAGTPVVVARNSSLPEVVGDAGYYLPEKPCGTDIAEAVTRILTNEGLRTAMVARGRVQAASFCWRQTAIRTLDVYAAAVGKKSRPV